MGFMATHEWVKDIPVTAGTAVPSSFRSGGDILIPICCVPFCGLAGREHMFDDDEIEKVIREVSAGFNHSDLDDMLRLGEGSRFSDIRDTFPCIPDLGWGINSKD